jgi:hypothetical protein
MPFPPEQLVQLSEVGGIAFTKHEYEAVHPKFNELVGAVPGKTGLSFGYGPEVLTDFSSQSPPENITRWQEVLDNTYISTDGGLYLEGSATKLFEYSQGTLTKVGRQWGKDVLFLDRPWVTGSAAVKSVWLRGWTGPVGNVYTYDLRGEHSYTGISSMFRGATDITGNEVTVTPAADDEWFYDHSAGTIQFYHATKAPNSATNAMKAELDVNYVHFADPLNGILPGFPHVGVTSVDNLAGTPGSITIPDLSNVKGEAASGYLILSNTLDGQNTLYYTLATDNAGITFDCSGQATWEDVGANTVYKLPNFSSLFPLVDTSLTLPITWLKVYGKHYTRNTHATLAAGDWWYDKAADILYIYLENPDSSGGADDRSPIPASGEEVQIICGTGSLWFDSNKRVPTLDGTVQEMLIFGQDLLLFSSTNATRMRWVGAVNVLGQTASVPFFEDKLNLAVGQNEFVAAFEAGSSILAVWDKGVFVLQSTGSDGFIPLFKEKEFSRLVTTLRGKIVDVGISYGLQQIILKVQIPFHDDAGADYFSNKILVVDYGRISDLLTDTDARVFELALGFYPTGLGITTEALVVWFDQVAYAMRERSTSNLGGVGIQQGVENRTPLATVTNGSHVEYYYNDSYVWDSGSEGFTFIPFIVDIDSYIGLGSDGQSVLGLLPSGEFYVGGITSGTLAAVSTDFLEGFEYRNIDGKGIPAGTKFWLGYNVQYLKVTFRMGDVVSLQHVGLPIDAESDLELWYTIGSDQGRVITNHTEVQAGKSMVRLPCGLLGSLFTLQLAVPIPKVWELGTFNLSVASAGKGK